MSLLAAMQCKAALWILGAFYTLPTSEIEALVSLISIYLHFKKLVKQSCLKTTTLFSQHILISLLSAKNTFPYPQLLALLNNAKCACLFEELFFGY